MKKKFFVLLMIVIVIATTGCQKKNETVSTSKDEKDMIGTYYCENMKYTLYVLVDEDNYKLRLTDENGKLVLKTDAAEKTDDAIWMPNKDGGVLIGSYTEVSVWMHKDSLYVGIFKKQSDVARFDLEKKLETQEETTVNAQTTQSTKQNTVVLSEPTERKTGSNINTMAWMIASDSRKSIKQFVQGDMLAGFTVTQLRRDAASIDKHIYSSEDRALAEVLRQVADLLEKDKLADQNHVQYKSYYEDINKILGTK